MQLDQPLSEKEFDELDNFLLSGRCPEGAMTMDTLHGYLTAIAIGPDTIMPAEWLPHVWGEEPGAVPTWKNPKEEERIVNLIMRFMNEVLVTFEVAPKADVAPEVFAAQDARAVVNFLFTMAHGVVAMSPDIADLVQTSTNLAMIATKGGLVEVCTSQRSSIASSKWDIANRISAFCEMAGFEAVRGDGYPGWKPDPKAALVQVVNDVHQKTFGKPMAIKAIHAGLECGLIGEKYPEMQMVSFGPSMWDVHTPEENISVSSVGNFWTLLVAVLENV